MLRVVVEKCVLKKQIRCRLHPPSPRPPLKKAATRQEIPIESVAEAANSVITHGVTVAKVSHDPTQASDEAGE